MSVVIVGAGPAGVRAAQTLLEAGIRPVLIDENVNAGGQIYRRPPPSLHRPYKTLYGSEAEKALRLHGDFDALKAHIDYRPGMLVWGIFGQKLYASSDDGQQTIAFDRLILATGATDRLLPVRGWTMPGVFSLGGAQIALKAQDCTIGLKAVLVGTGPLLYLLAVQYLRAGRPPVALCDTTPFATQIRHGMGLILNPRVLALGLRYRLALARAGVPIWSGVVPRSIEGDERVETFRFTAQDGEERGLACDGIALGFGLRSETQLAELAGVEFAFDRELREWLPQRDDNGRTSRANIYLAGDGSRIAGADAAEHTGRIAALSVLSDLGLGSPPRPSRVRGILDRGFRKALERSFPWPYKLAKNIDDDVIVCRCETITAGEVRATAAIGAQEVNRTKALSRVGMGRCQGRYCGLAAAEILAASLDVDVSAIGHLRPQAPIKPLLNLDDSPAQ